MRPWEALFEILMILEQLWSRMGSLRQLGPEGGALPNVVFRVPWGGQQEGTRGTNISHTPVDPFGVGGYIFPKQALHVGVLTVLLRGLDLFGAPLTAAGEHFTL